MRNPTNNLKVIFLFTVNKGLFELLCQFFHASLCWYCMVGHVLYSYFDKHMQLQATSCLLSVFLPPYPHSSAKTIYLH